MQHDRYRDITIQQIEALNHLVEEGSFSRAAKKMFLTQPALTKQIKNLEDSLGIKVANRSTKGVSLTPGGKIYLEYARKILKLRNEARDRILALAERNSGILHIGASTIPAAHILPGILSRFKKDYPRIQIKMQTSDSEKILDSILDSRLELGFVGKDTPNKKIHSEPFWKDRLALVVPENHPFRGKKSVTMKMLRREPFIIREKGSATREILESFLRHRESTSLAHFDVVGELGGPEAVKEAILAGLGISIISVQAVRRELSQGILFDIALENCTIERNFYLIYRRQFDLMAYHRAFINFARNFSI